MTIGASSRRWARPSSAWRDWAFVSAITPLSVPGPRSRTASPSWVARTASSASRVVVEEVEATALSMFEMHRPARSSCQVELLRQNRRERFPGARCVPGQARSDLVRDHDLLRAMLRANARSWGKRPRPRLPCPRRSDRCGRRPRPGRRGRRPGAGAARRRSREGSHPAALATCSRRGGAAAAAPPHRNPLGSLIDQPAILERGHRTRRCGGRESRLPGQAATRPHTERRSLERRHDRKLSRRELGARASDAEPPSHLLELAAGEIEPSAVAGIGDAQFLDRAPHTRNRSPQTSRRLGHRRSVHIVSFAALSGRANLRLERRDLGGDPAPTDWLRARLVAFVREC